jgi:predicted CXXCH cytochrome family protein
MVAVIWGCGDSDRPPVQVASITPQSPPDEPKYHVIPFKDDPRILYWWDEIPDEVRQHAVSTDGRSNIRPNDYAGPRSCEECHTKNFEEWSEHSHRWMNAPANEITVRGDFSGNAKINYYGGEGIYFRDQGEYRLRLVRGDVTRIYQITQTLGSRFFQYYVGRQIEGPEPTEHKIYKSEHVMPFGYWIDRKEWIPVVHVERAREGQPSLTDDLQRDPYSDPIVRDYAESCAICHTTMALGDWLARRRSKSPPSPRGFHFEMASYLHEARPDVLGPEFNTKDLGGKTIGELDVRVDKLNNLEARFWETTTGITCEACHGGSKFHVEDEDLMPDFFPNSPHLAVLAEDEDEAFGRTLENQNWVCARCHDGQRFLFAGGMATWNSTEYTDSQKGGCYEAAEGLDQLTCTHCHNPHKSIGRKWTKTPDEDDADCLSCHKQYRASEARLAHTHHPDGSAGARCMNCHMPKINEGLQDMVRTHTIFSPTNEIMLKADQPNACSMCHVEKTIDWTLEHLKEWYGLDIARSDFDLPYRREYEGGPAILSWLQSEHASTRMVAMDSLVKAKARWSMPDLVEMLDDDHLINRQFTRVGLEDWLGIALLDHGYRFYMLGDERRESMHEMRASLLSEADIFDQRKSIGVTSDHRLIRLAWTLAVAPNPDHRDPKRAVEIAERIAKQGGDRDARVLDVLAAAYASAGQYDRAGLTAQTAVAIANQRGDRVLADLIKRRMDLYWAGKPYVDEADPAVERPGLLDRPMSAAPGKETDPGA